jgi:hypothetical protein
VLEVILRAGLIGEQGFAKKSSRKEPNGAGDMAQVGECLSSRHKALSSNPSANDI